MSGPLTNAPFVTVATFSHSIEAHVAKIKLETEGVFCLLADENTVNANWLYSNLLGGVKLRVRPADFASARKILELPSEPEYESERCPKCKSKGIFEQRHKRKAAFVSWLLLGFPLPYGRRKVCGACAHEWKR